MQHNAHEKGNTLAGRYIVFAMDGYTTMVGSAGSQNGHRCRNWGRAQGPTGHRHCEEAFGGYKACWVRY